MLRQTAYLLHVMEIQSIYGMEKSILAHMDQSVLWKKRLQHQ